MTLLTVEIKRALHRRVVWVLVAVAGVGLAVMGTVAYLDSRDLDPARLARENTLHPAVMRDWWVSGGGDGVLLVGALFLFMGAVIGGASAVGAEWRAGTLPTLLTWEPRRTRLAFVRFLACGLCAGAISVGLQVVMLGGLLPAVFAHGTTAGVDGDWWLALGAAVLRVALVTSMAAVLAAAIALAARNTAAALVATWVWVALVENMARGLKPWTSRYLITDNAARVVTWADLGNPGVSRSPLVALLLLAGYLALTASISIRVFQRSDAVVG